MPRANGSAAHEATDATRTLHTAEPLYALDFPRGADALDFVSGLRALAASRPGPRIAPPGPVVIFGPAAIDPARLTRLYVTNSILRAAERAGIVSPPIAGRLSDARQLPSDAVALLATLGDGADGSRRAPAADHDEPRQ
jgi:hypothetical protein